MDSIRGLSTRSKASLTELKSVIAEIESDVTELKNATNHDILDLKLGALADKITQLENTFKVKIDSLSGRVIDLETDNDSLRAENTKLKNDIQTLKQRQRENNKRLDTLEATKYAGKTAETTTTDMGTDPGTDATEIQADALVNNPFSTLLTLDQDTGNLSTETTTTHQKSPRQSSQNIQSSITDTWYEQSQDPGAIPRYPPKNGKNPDIILLIDSNGKFIQEEKFSRDKVVQKFFSPSIASAIEIVTNNDLGTPSSLIVHTGTNDIEKSSTETCFENFQALIDLTAQKFPNTKIIISSLLVRNDKFDATRSELNNKLSHLRSYANVHIVNNEHITNDMLHDRKHIKKRKVGLLVSNIKDCVFNRISRRVNPQSNTNTKPSSFPRQPNHPPKAPNIKPATPEANDFRFNLLQPQLPRSFAEVVKHTGNSKSLDHDTVASILKLYEIFRQS